MVPPIRDARVTRSVVSVRQTGDYRNRGASGFSGPAPRVRFLHGAPLAHASFEQRRLGVTSLHPSARLPMKTGVLASWDQMTAFNRNVWSIFLKKDRDRKQKQNRKLYFFSASLLPPPAGGGTTLTLVRPETVTIATQNPAGRNVLHKTT